jgi:putative ABC transport system permease protein
MQSWLWRWVEWRLQRDLPPMQQLTTLGDLAEDFDSRLQTSGRVRAELRLLRETRAVAVAYRTRHQQPHHRRPFMERLRLPETRLAIRRLAKQPAATLASVATLATAFAAALATWVLIDSVLLTPIQAHRPDRLQVVGERYQNPDGTLSNVSTTHVFTAVERVRSSGAFAEIAAIGRHYARVGDPSRPVSQEVAFITPSLFDVLGVRLARGPGFRAEDDREGAPLTTILSHHYWQTERGGAPDILGETIAIGTQTARIVGVTPEGFRGLDLANAPALYLPVHTAYDVLGTDMDYLGFGRSSSAMRFFMIVGRLPDGGAAERAAAALQALPALPRPSTLELLPLHVAALPEAARPNMHRFTQLLAATVCLLLLIGSLTVGLLVLVRSESRREELAICLALGATKWRLVRGVLAESVVLSACGLVFAVPLTIALLSAARTFELPGRISVDLLRLHLDVTAMLIGLAMAGLSTVIIGLVAGFVGVGGNIAELLRARTGATPRLSRRRTRQGLVIAQVAVTMVLLVGTGLFARSVLAALSLNAAYDPKNVVTTTLSLRGLPYAPADIDRFFIEVRDRMTASPTVLNAALRADQAGMNSGGRVEFNGEERVVPSFLSYTVVDDHYFSTLGLPILRGRDFLRTDSPTSPAVAIVSESLGRFVARGGDPLGMTVAEVFHRPGEPPDVMRIVGVVPDVVTNVTVLAPLTLYYPMAQRPPASASQTLYARTRTEAGSFARELRGVVDQLDPRVAPTEPITLAERIARQMAPQQFGAAILGALALVALILTLLGTFVIAETMAKARERELGVRAALGATARHLGGLIVHETVVLVGLGLVVGLGLTWVASSTVQALLYQVTPFDTPSLLIAATTMLVLALLVSARPALRATRVNVAVLLRD